MGAQSIGTLSPHLVEAWAALHASDGGLSGPFLHPSYAQAVGAVRDGVEVGIITSGGEVVGFLPFQRSVMGIGGPIGSRLCDVAGALVKPGATWHPEAFARAARLRTLRLPNVPTSMSMFETFQRPAGTAPLLDLSDGFETYREASLESGSSFMRQLERKARKLEREVAPWRFEWHTDDDDVFDKLLSWKSSQRKSTRTPNVLHLPWARALVERLRNVDDAAFGGVLSALYVGDTLAAAHFGLRTRTVLHYWIPAYNAEFAAYSPGLLALVELARAAAERGIRRIDLGSGEERYKQRAATGAIPMTVATVNTNAAYRAATGAVDHLRAWSHGSRWGEVLRTAGRGLTRGSYRMRSVLTSSLAR